MPRPSQRSSRCCLPQTEALADNPPTGRFDRTQQLGRSSRLIRKTRRSIIPPSQRSSATIITEIDRSLRSHIDQSREPPASVGSKHHQSPYTPSSSIPSKRPHPVDANSDSRGSPRKRHCLVHQGVSELCHTVTPAADLLPQFLAIDDVVTRPSDTKFEGESPQDGQCHSRWSLTSTTSGTTISPGTQENGTSGQRSTSARTTEEHNQLDQPTRSINHQAKPVSKRPSYDKMPSETFDTKAYQKLESPHRTTVGNTESSPYEELPNPNKPSESKNPSRDKSNISKSPAPTTASVLDGWPLIFACIAALIGGMFFPDLRIPEFRVVDWNERAIELEIALVTIPRVVLFGEASLSQQRLQPGMLPVDGFAHDHNPLFGPNVKIPLRSKWFSNSTEFPHYEPWLTTSAGVFVPEKIFLDDLEVVTVKTCFDLGSIPISDGPSPSDDFCRLLSRALAKFDSFYFWEDRRLGVEYNYDIVAMNLVMLRNMIYVQEMQRNGSEELGSDRLRAHAMHAPTTTTISLPTVKPPSPRRLLADTSIPEDIPESFIKEIPRPSDYAEAQLNNGTANILVQYVIDVIVGRRLNETNEAEGPPYGNIMEHSAKLDKLCHLFKQLNDYVPTIIRYANRTALSADLSSRLQRIQDTAPFLRDIATPRLAGMQARAKRGVQLLREIEKRQAELQNEIERTLQNGWLAPGPGVGWLSFRVIYYHLPDLKSMALQWSYARRWLAVESEQVFEVYRGRMAEFYSRYEYLPRNLPKRQLDEWLAWSSQMIWSRWSLEDRREDPVGKEAFCWALREWQPSVSTWQRMVGWMTGQGDDDDVPSKCGDASRRHG
ncbi:hypothetical protein BHE90_014743 [Fusarium euwallaceae]|uniref:Uncharacterized protein n=1 Tax=Fusarium euwallaceae TaxID=1147111 RepID=A0A430L533_9HYPO|nr:hypothetical protein BHE90_014743 [Fusarium euwallaceae]